MYLIWIGIVVALSLIELITVNLTTILFVVSGLVALILSFFIKNFIIQFSLFVILGLLLIYISRKYLMDFLIKKNKKLNLNKFVGMKGKVIKEIRKNHNGKVSIDGVQLIAYADKKIMVDKSVEVLLINGLKIKVKEVEE